MDASTLAVALAFRLMEVLPDGFSATGYGHRVTIWSPRGWSAGGWVGMIDVVGREPANYEGAAWNVLSKAQDVVSESTAMPWPRARGECLDLALPGARCSDGVLHLWYGDEGDPVLRLRPIDLMA